MLHSQQLRDDSQLLSGNTVWSWRTRDGTEKQGRRAVAWRGVNEKAICLSRMPLCRPGKSQSRISEYLIQLFKKKKKKKGKNLRDTNSYCKFKAKALNAVNHSSEGSRAQLMGGVASWLHPLGCDSRLCSLAVQHSKVSNVLKVGVLFVCFPHILF